jgi:hypothetical protein
MINRNQQERLIGGSLVTHEIVECFIGHRTGRLACARVYARRRQRSTFRRILTHGQTSLWTEVQLAP